MRSLLWSIRLLVACALALLVASGATLTSAATPLQPLSPSASMAQDDEEDNGEEGNTDGDTDTDTGTGAGAGTASGALDEPANRPAHIHPGTCDELDPNPAFPLENVEPFSGEDDEVEHSATTVEASLDDILAAPHAINVHLSPEQADIYVACGEITGTVEDGELVIALHQQNGSGLAGIAMLTEDDDSTEVHVYLAPIDPETDTGATTGTDATTPAAVTGESTAADTEEDGTGEGDAVTATVPAEEDGTGEDADAGEDAATPSAEEDAGGADAGGAGEDSEGEGEED